jgi:hypothetical protein
MRKVSYLTVHGEDGCWAEVYWVCGRLTDLLIDCTKNLIQFQLLNDCSLCQLMQLLIVNNSVKLYVGSIAIIARGAYPL